MGLKKIIREIGEATFSYPFEKFKEIVDDEDIIVEYIFRSEENVYYVIFETLDYKRNPVQVKFSVDRPSYGKKKVDLTGENRPTKILSTVINIAKQFEKEYSFIKSFEFSIPMFSGSDRQKRIRVYKKYIQSAFPNAEINKLYGTTHVVKK